MLCQVCASIDLKDALGAIPDSLDVPLLKKNTFTPRVLHYETYAGMLATVKHYQLYTLVVKSFNSSTYWRPGPDTPIYRSVEREEREKDLFPNQARQLTVMSFGNEYHGMSMELDFCSVELYVQGGKLLVMEAIHKNSHVICKS